MTLVRSLLVAPLVLGTTAHADPHDTAFEVGVVMPVLPQRDTYGFGIALGGHYTIRDRVSIGARVEATAIGGAWAGGINGDDPFPGFGTTLGGVVDGECVLARSARGRVFVAFGVGAYRVGAPLSSGAGTVTAGNGTFLALAPAIGVELGVARLAIVGNHYVGGDIRTTDVDSNPHAYSQDSLEVELTFRFTGDAPGR